MARSPLPLYGNAKPLMGARNMQVQDVMSRDVIVVNPWESLKTAARRMADLDVGALPVGDNDQLIGMVTDRDMVIRGLAIGKGPTAKVGDVMTPDIKYCFQDQEVDEVATNMADIQVRRLPVVDRNKRLVGILALGDIATCEDGGRAAEALSGISRPAAQSPLD
jgi:CBS domain-containing protein